MKGVGNIAVFTMVVGLAGVTASGVNAQDVEHGKTVFKACAACHATDHANRVGPGLAGLVGRKAGSVAGFRYSNAMKKSDIVWDVRSSMPTLNHHKRSFPETECPMRG